MSEQEESSIELSALPQEEGSLKWSPDSKDDKFKCPQVARPSYMHAASPNPCEDLRPSLSMHVMGTRQKLLPLYVEDNSLAVYLRVRPFSQEERDRGEDQGCMVLHGSSVVMNAPQLSCTSKNAAGRSTSSQFSFTEVFNEDTSQENFYLATTQGMVEKFLKGQDCCLFCHGVTGSGKTYSIQGSQDNPGVLPRALDGLLRGLDKCLLPRSTYKPQTYRSVQLLTNQESDIEMKLKEEMMNWAESSNESNLTKMSSLSASGVSMSSSCSSLADVVEPIEITPEHLVSSTDSKYLLWVSFYEIYNEIVFDLLIPNTSGAKRASLRLGEDKKGNTFVKGLREVWVQTADEALKLLSLGKKQLSFASTRMNYSSSRSHCIFTIKVIHVDTTENKVTNLNRFTICDLAGCERSRKTGFGATKETGNINSSLMTLGRCIETVRANQKRKDNLAVVPFRNCKLTRLLQNCLSGWGVTRMVVNVSPCASSFDETLHVLKFSAIAKQVRSRPTELACIEMSSVCDFPGTSRQTMDWENGGDVSERCDSPDEAVIKMREYAMQLRDIILMERRANRDVEDNIKKEISLKYDSLLREMQQRHDEALDNCREECDNAVQTKMKILQEAYDKREEYWREMMQSLDDSDESIHDGCEENDIVMQSSKMETELSAKNSVPLAQMSFSQDSLENENEDVHVTIGNLRSELKDKTAECEELTTLLEEAGATFNEKEEIIEKLNNRIRELQVELVRERKLKEVEFEGCKQNNGCQLGVNRNDVRSRSVSPSRIQLTSATLRMINHSKRELVNTGSCVQLQSTAVEDCLAVGPQIELSPVKRSNLSVSVALDSGDHPADPISLGPSCSPILSPIQPTPPFATSKKFRKRRPNVKPNKACLLLMNSSPSVRKSTIDRFFGMNKYKKRSVLSSKVLKK